ncbi:MAG: YceI family protein [Rhodothermales bacterium]|nr:YceI family protein [Rhodothermales bacterium]MBO6779323.1 YceI family protein [Rhodothermales bacterium]
MRTALLIPVLACATIASAQMPVDVLPSSRAWIEGSASGRKFVCQVDSVAGTGSWDKTVSGELAISVEGIACENRRMTADLRDLLDVTAHPFIEYEVLRAWPESDSASAVADGWLTVAGASRQTQVSGTLERVNAETARLRGSVDLMLTDFGLQPPTKFFGLIKVRNRITVRFDIQAAVGAAAVESTPMNTPTNRNKS